MALATVHAGLAPVAHGLRARVLVCSIAATAAAATAAAALLHIVKAFADGFEGGEDGVVGHAKAGGELVR